MKKMILVTGCAGFIGSNFCRLYAPEYDIIGIDALERGSHPKNIPNEIRFQQMDITDCGALNRLFEQESAIQGIINFAAQTHVDHSLEDDEKFWKSNVEGARILAQMALSRNIRLLQVSTDEVYGPSDQGIHFDENSPLNPRNPYAASKAAGDLLLLSYAHAYGLNCVITRGVNTMGPRQSPDKLIPKAIFYFLSGRPFPLYQTPAKRLWISAEDHCRAILTIFQKGQTKGVYNISPPQENEIETHAVVEKIRSLMGRGEIKLVPDRKAYDLRYLICSEKLRHELGWRPQHAFYEMLTQTIEWYIQNQEWINAAARSQA